MDPRRRHSLKTIAAVAFAGLCAVAVASPFKITVAPLFQGERSQGTMPLAITVRNSGPDYSGLLHVSTPTGETDYPLQVTRGGAAKVVVYSSGMELTANVANEPGTTTPLNFSGWSDGSVPNVLVIGDDFGDFASLSGAHPSRTSQNTVPGAPDTMSDIYCRPEDAPARIVAYESVSAVILGPGAERMSDATVQALKDWALEGGTLVFLGGTSGNSLSDPRWQSDLPATDFVAKSVDNVDGLEQMGAEELRGPITLYEPQDIHGATLRKDGDNVLTAESGYGFGRILCTAFDPLDPKLSSWPGTKYAMHSLLLPALNTAPMAAVNAFGGDPQPTTYGQAAANDPFSAKLPPVSQVFGILVAYFVTVLPLNFLVLRKIRRAELAWFTAPVLSLGFASILFHSAGNLYGDSLSTASKGVLVVRSGSQDAVFSGNTQIFVPHGGHYDLGLSDIDSVGQVFENGGPTMVSYTQGGSYDSTASARYDGTPDMTQLDDGQIHIDNLSTGNLAFRQIGYTQRLRLADEYSVTVHQEGDRAVCEIKNGSNAPLSDARLFVRNQTAVLNPIPAHSTKTISVNLAGGPQNTSQFTDSQSIRSAVVSNGDAALEATLTDGFRPGPQIGQQVDSRTQVTLVVFSKDALGGHR